MHGSPGVKPGPGADAAPACLCRLPVVDISMVYKVWIIGWGHYLPLSCCRSSFPEVAHALQLHAAEWLRNLSGGRCSWGVIAPGLPHV